MFVLSGELLSTVIYPLMTRGGELGPDVVLVAEKAQIRPLSSCHVQTSRNLEGTHAHRIHRTGCRLAGCTQRSIRRDITEGRLRGYRFGRRLVLADLDQGHLQPIPTIGTIC